MVVLCAVTLITCITYPEKTEAQEAIGLQTRIFGSVQPIETHNSTNNTNRSTSLGFGVGVEALYRLPIETVAIDVGLGVRWHFDRAVNGSEQYNLLPIYAVAQLPLSFPNLADFLNIYLEGKIGYVVMLTNALYEDVYLEDDNINNGGIFYGLGIGIVYTPVALIQFYSAVAFHGIGIASTQKQQEITDLSLDVTLGVGFKF